MQQVLCNWQKPQLVASRLIAQHMLVENAWILDAGCGSASATMSALNAGMNAIAYDHQNKIVKGVVDR